MTPALARTTGRATLVVAPNWLGDAVMALPFVRALRRARPNDSLTVLARRGPAALFRAEGSADGVWVAAGLARDVVALSRSRLDQAWILPNSFRSALPPFLARVPERIGYATDGRSAFLTVALPRPAGMAHQLRDYDALLVSRGIEPDRDPPLLPIPPAAQDTARRAFAAAGLPGGAPLVLLAPGAAFGPTKQWPAERFAALADKLAERGVLSGIVVGPGEERLGEEVSRLTPHRPVVLGADLDPIELAALLRQARAVVGNDSGPMHLAAAVGTPVVTLFGPTDPGRTSPTGAPARVLDRYLFCSPCFLKHCPYGHECMEEISAEMALAAVEELLSG
jgi:heptosyltransferase-2